MDAMQCQCCKEDFETLSEEKLCFACNTFFTLASVIKDHTDLDDERSMKLAEDLQETILSMILERPKGVQSLEDELSRTMEPVEAAS
jgi:hypothetical protein